MVVETIEVIFVPVCITTIVWLALHCYLLQDTLNYAREENKSLRKEMDRCMNAYMDCNLKLHELNGEKCMWTSSNRRNVFSRLHGCGTAYPNGMIVYDDGTVVNEKAGDE